MIKQRKKNNKKRPNDKGFKTNGAKEKIKDVHKKISYFLE